MDLLKVAVEWAKDEMFSTRFFILAGVLFLLTSTGLWQLGKTDLARAYIIPLIVAGLLLTTIGVGLYYTNKARRSNFSVAYQKDASTFLTAELARAESTLKEYSVVLKVVPLLILISSLIVMFIDRPVWRASAITAIAMLTVILLIDGMAHARMEVYHKQLSKMNVSTAP